MQAQIPGGDRIGFSVAGLELWLDARGSGVRLATPPGHARFSVGGADADSLSLRVRDGPLSGTQGWESLFYDAGTWQRWRDGAGRHVFVAPGGSPPPRQIAVDPAFACGEVVGQFGTSLPKSQGVYPLQDIDMMLFANWLAESGDLIVHASGIDDDGAGYAFVGPSGSGKSTLAAELASRSSCTVLGEDQVIVRHLEGRFMVYGTPWHTNPELCSPGGVPLQKLFFLDRTLGHGVKPCGRTAGVARLLQDALIPYYNRAGLERILDSLTRLAEQVPFYTLGFQVGADALKLIREA